MAGLLTIPLLGFFRSSFSVPYDYDGDATFYLMVIRQLSREGTYLANDQMGFPHGAQLYDLPQGVDHLHLLVLRVFGLVLSPGAAMNLFFLLGFIAAAAMAHYVLRRLGGHGPISAAVALLYAFLPYHLLRGASHLFLSSYWLVPVGVWFVLTVMGDDPPFVGTRRRWWPGLRFDCQARWVTAGCIGIASSGSYYAVFLGYLAVVAGLLVSVGRRHTRHLWSGVLVAGITAATMLVHLLPTILYWRANGSNPAVFERRVQETEEYGLRIQQLFLPRIGHRIGELSRAGFRAFAGPVYSEQGQTLGVVLACGFVVVVIAGLASAVGGSSPRGRLSTIAHAGIVAVIAMITATVSGVSFLLALGGLSQIRGWNRISIHLAFLGAIGLTLGASIAAERLRSARGERPARIAGVVVAVVMLGVGLFDQTSPVDAAHFDAVEPVWRNDQAFFESMAASLPAGSAVYQFPEQTFPEGGAVKAIGLYDGARGYLHAPQLKWSFGAVTGRVPPRPADLPLRPPAEIAAALVAEGFSALVVDRFGYADSGVAFIDALGQLGAAAGMSGDGRYVWFDLRPFGGGAPT